jgi:hypothetical protein
MCDEESLDVGGASYFQVVTSLVYVNAVEPGEGTVNGHFADAKMLSGSPFVDGCAYDVPS